MNEALLHSGAPNALMLKAQNALPGGSRSLAAKAGHGDPKRVREVAQEFEAIFLGQLLQPMFDSIKTEQPFGGGYAEEMWRSMQVAEYGKAIARAGGVGIGDAVYRQLMRLQEVN